MFLLARAPELRTGVPLTAWSGTWSTIGTRASPVPIAKSPSVKSTGTTGNPLSSARTATPRSGARFRQKIGPLFFKTSFRCAGVASSRKTTDASVPNSSWIADGNVAWVASMFRRNQRKMFRRNQSAATETALKLVLTGGPFKLATPHPSLGICEAPAEAANARNEERIPHKHPPLVPLRSQW
jgi:hypothetical protein